jgi:hypothetical protein
MAAAETIASDTRIGFWRVSLGGQLQEIAFGSLIDNRGNHLPETIKSPAVIVIPRGKQNAFIKNIKGETGFAIARSEGAQQTVMVDIMIFETGL